jgi:hypothetical protein
MRVNDQARAHSFPKFSLTVILHSFRSFSRIGTNFQRIRDELAHDGIRVISRAHSLVRECIIHVNHNCLTS